VNIASDFAHLSRAGNGTGLFYVQDERYKFFVHDFKEKPI